MLKRNRLVFLLLFLLIFTLAVPCLAKDNAKKEAIDAALSRSEDETAIVENVEKAKKLEEDVKSFKRLELAYESLWITSSEGKAKVRWQNVFGTGYLKINFQPKTRLNIYRALFHATPRIYVEGSYGSGDIQKSHANFSIIGGPLEGSVDGTFNEDNLRLWDSTLGFTIYKNTETGLAIDIFGGYTYFRGKISASDISGLTTAVYRTYQGPYFGLKLNAPFTIPEFPNNPFAFKLKVGYGPIMDMKNRESLYPLADPEISHSGKGYYIEARAALSWKIFKNLFLEAAYNYFRFDQTSGSEGMNTNVLGIVPTTLDRINSSLTMHGPSAQARLEF